MPRCASNSARCGPTPLIMRTSVLRFIAIGKYNRKAVYCKRNRKAVHCKRDRKAVNRERARKAGNGINSISFLPRPLSGAAAKRPIVSAAAQRPTGWGETCVPTIRIDRVSVPCPKRGGSCDRRPFDGFRQARAVALGGGGNPWRAVCLQVFFSRFPRSVR